jgi:hypothetical protein
MSVKTCILSAIALLTGCAAIPPNSPYIACAGGEKYKVCERIKYCYEGKAVLIKDHFWYGRMGKSVEPPCGEG